MWFVNFLGWAFVYQFLVTYVVIHFYNTEWVFRPIRTLLLVATLRLKSDGTRTETIFRLSAKQTSPFKSAGASAQSTTGSRSVRISGSNAGHNMFRGSVKSTGYPVHSPFSLSLPFRASPFAIFFLLYIVLYQPSTPLPPPHPVSLQRRTYLTYLSFATRVSQIKIWHFWVIGI